MFEPDQATEPVVQQPVERRALSGWRPFNGGLACVGTLLACVLCAGKVESDDAQPSVSQNWSCQISRMRFEDLSQEVVEKLTVTLCDAAAVMIYASENAKVQAFREVERAQGSTNATEFVMGTQVDPQSAAAINAFALQAPNMADSNIRCEVRASPVAVPAVLAAAEVADISGKEFLAALAVSYEITDRLGRFLNETPHYELFQRGFMTSSVCGAVGAAAGAGKALKLSEEQLAAAVGMAAMGANGTFQYTIDLSDGRRINIARSQRIGLQSALLARRGFRPSPNSIEGTFGFLNAFGGKGNHEKLRSCKFSWDAVLYVKPKFYSTSNTFAPFLDALRSLKSEKPFLDENIEEIEIHVNLPEGKAARNYLHRFELDPPTSVAKAHFDPRYTIALFLTNGSAFVNDYTPANLKDQQILELSQRIHVNQDESVQRKHLVEVRLADGRMLEKSVLYTDLYKNKYTPEYERYARKFKILTADLSKKDQTQVLRHLQSVEDAGSMQRWCRQLASLTKRH